MSKISRRSVLLASVSTVVLVGVTLYAAPSLGVAPLEYFGDKKDRMTASYSEARSTVKGMVGRTIDVAKKEGMKFSDADFDRIHNRIWDQTHYLLSEYYEFKD